MPIVQRIFISAALILLCGILGANVYNSFVDAQNWGSAIPQSLDTAKAYFAHMNPGNFYRVAAPAAQLTALVTLIVSWPLGKNARLLAGAALLLAVSGDILTFAYFYPRNAIMFGQEQHSLEVLREAWTGWNAMNWVRSGILLAAVICELNLFSIFERRVAKTKLEGQLQ